MRREVDALTLPLAAPMTTAHGVFSDRHIAVATITDDSGFRGHGEVAVLPGFGLESQAEAEQALHAWVATGRTPTGRAAAGAIRTAEASLAAATSGSTLAEHLAAGPTRSTVRTQVVIGDGEVAQTVTAAARAVAAGFSTLKVKVAAGPPRRDIDRIAAIRSEVGAGVDLRLDANGGWDIDTANDALHSVGEYRIDLVEEPTTEPRDFAQLQSSTGITIALDEHAANGPAVTSAVDAGIGAVVLKPAILGGPVATHELALSLLDRGVRVIVSSFMDGPIGLGAAVEVAASLPHDEVHGLGTATMFAEPFPARLVPERGLVRAAASPAGTDVLQ